ncbi:uncharacterized protein MELLADRAFT_73092 [Melampsora larici-populina 98AG31]|uniref:Uncharacterized protein n=1 Tax=Melampsora larici-populina (strain 98AG31 / pathotype 3-4-7) TaxID=747676 RepID=F4S314_MELLP|nr:uncharacterized protein MELLADRAFT_73092 [Melampsora larici-populina 98AG31]EGG00897.1 hypothetical protein MELLADRAFT_73092 [Melampsora larici-populina 98AG31]
MSLGMAHELLSGNTPFLNQLWIAMDEIKDTSDLKVRFDLPALKTLHVGIHRFHDLLENFENCKSVEVLEYHGVIEDDAWDSLQSHLSRRTWPKLLVLDVRNLHVDVGEARVRLTREKMEEILKTFDIKVKLIKD